MVGLGCRGLEADLRLTRDAAESDRLPLGEKASSPQHISPGPEGGKKLSLGQDVIRSSGEVKSVRECLGGPWGVWKAGSSIARREQCESGGGARCGGLNA